MVKSSNSKFTWCISYLSKHLITPKFYNIHILITMRFNKIKKKMYLSYSLTPKFLLFVDQILTFWSLPEEIKNSLWFENWRLITPPSWAFTERSLLVSLRHLESSNIPTFSCDHEKEVNIDLVPDFRISF